MNKPRVLIRMATARPFRSEQTLAPLFLLVPGAVLLSALPLGQELTCRVRLRDYHRFLVKNVRISLCNLACTKVFTLSPFKVLRERNLQSRNLKSSGRKTTKTGGRTPLFRLSAAQKVSWGRSRPFCVLPRTTRRTVNCTHGKMPCLKSNANAPIMKHRLTVVLRPAWQAHGKENTRNASPESTTEAHSQCDDSGSS
jgi:hypothetical protein